MVALILFILFGLVFGYFSTLNTATASIHFGFTSLSHVPMYILVLASFGIGVLFTSLFYILRSISSGMEKNKKEKELIVFKEESVLLTKKIHELEIDNAKLKTRIGETDTDEDSL
jgi:uncharacterized integral membrane protein